VKAFSDKKNEPKPTPEIVKKQPVPTEPITPEEKKPLEKDNLIESFEKDGEYQATYAFIPIDSEICDYTTKCLGWSLRGSYSVMTDTEGKSFLKVHMKLKAPYKIKANSTIIGIAFGIGYAKFKKTEAAFAVKTGYSYLSKWDIGGV